MTRGTISAVMASSAAMPNNEREGPVAAASRPRAKPVKLRCTRTVEETAATRATVASRPTQVPLEPPSIPTATYSCAARVQRFGSKSCHYPVTPDLVLIRT
jgi:hypothetical protein